MKDRQIQRMLKDIEREVQYTRNMIGKDALDPRVMAVMANTPRHEFVPKSFLNAAFNNGPLPIGHGQTISQPYIVALMTDMLALEADHVVLEIGTGSGYQTAVLSQLCKRVYTIEYIPALADAARLRLQKHGYDNIEFMTGNGYEGWPEQAPFDGIIVTAAASHIPKPLVEQLKPGGRLVIPVGRPHLYQELALVEKNQDGEISIRNVLGVAFVPLQGERHDYV